MNTMLSVYEDQGYLNRSSVSQTFTLPRTQHGKTLLHQGFVPNCHTVICGRGKACTKAPGNINLKRIIDSFLEPYSKATNKLEKSSIVSSILAAVEQSSPQGAFVKYEDGLWWEVETGVAREKIGCMLRDCLHSQYRSSTKAKLARRKARKDWSHNVNNSGMVVSHHSNNFEPPIVHSSSSIDPLPISPKLTFPDFPSKSKSQKILSMDKLQECSDRKLKSQLQVEKSSSHSNRLRDLMPMSTHLDIMGDGNWKCPSNTVGEGVDQSKDLFSALDEACLLTADTEIEDMGLPDDISSISEEDIADLSDIFD